MKKIFALVLTLALALSFTACGSNAPASAAQNNNTSTVKVEKFSEKEVIQAADQLYIQLNDCAQQQDYQGYADLFVNTGDDVIKSMYDGMNLRSNYDQHFTLLACQADGYYCIGHTDAIVSGTYPNTNVNRGWFTALITYTADGWRYDLSDAAKEVIQEAMNETYPAGMQQAIKAGRNATNFNYGNFMHHDTSLVVDGVFDSNIMDLWQDEQGNLCIGVLINNGTDGNRTAQSMVVTIEDMNLGVVFEGDIGSQTVVKGSSKYVVVTVPAAQVRTGTAAWGTMRYNLNTRNL